jgi:hypothetical protein
VRDAIGVDKKHRQASLRWVLPTVGGTEIRDDVPDALVGASVASVLAGRPAAVGGSTR